MPYSYKTLTEVLAAAGIDEPAAEASLLICTYADITHSMLMAERDCVYDLPDLDAAATRRLARYPLQYILGTWNFYNSIIAVNEHCLIPRPDTEILVEEAIRLLPPNARFADLCTGSGCIAVAVLEERPDTTATALELYPETLALATRNAYINLVEARFTPVCADLLTNGREALTPHAPLDALLSNPPYILTSDLASLSPEVHHEPIAALDGGEDGLLFYRAILRDYASLLRPGGLILLEIGCDQADDLRRLAAELLPNATVTVKKDLAGRDRVVVLQLPA